MIFCYKILALTTTLQSRPSSHPNMSKRIMGCHPDRPNIQICRNNHGSSSRPSSHLNMSKESWVVIQTVPTSKYVERIMGCHPDCPHIQICWNNHRSSSSRPSSHPNMAKESWVLFIHTILTSKYVEIIMGHPHPDHPHIQICRNNHGCSSICGAQGGDRWVSEWVVQLISFWMNPQPWHLSVFICLIYEFIWKNLILSNLKKLWLCIFKF